MSRAYLINEARFKSEVLNAVQPVVVDFWAESCDHCKTVAPLLEEIRAETQGLVKVVRVNIDESPAIADHYHVESVPTLIYFANGLVHDQTVGPATKQEILAKIRALLR